MVGIFLLAITIFVHKNTYDYTSDERLVTPRWILILAVILTTIPVINLIAFIIGAISYIANIAESEIVFKCEDRWWKIMIEWLNKDISK
jgi:hypothetical protein